ncbi:MAG TPA: hypothetical protein VGO06_25235 [Bosea sp. (in: a-proteobacteria)]|jgi:hypothetical protein|uniref:hypothetical protein n=1 Tax=Bosea sp. (in: a-proteobacteria) TaxID=1871050 RepID=UPI002E12EFB9|nr:hypothetical protein [Bosea sp. (in: a-proteobacteria)]
MLGVVTAIALVWSISLALNAPGHLSYDSIVQLFEGRTGRGGSIHPPLMSMLLGAFDFVVPGTALYLLFVTALLLISVVLIVRATARPWFAFFAYAAISATPFLLIYQGIIWKDVLFANLAVLAFSVLLLPVAAGRSWQAIAVYGLAALLVGSALLTRQSGFLILPFFIAAICLTYRRLGWAKAASIGAAALAAVVMLSVALSLITTRAIQQRADGAFGTGLRVLMQYDIAGILVRAPGLLQPATSLPAENAPAILADLSARYTPERLDYLTDSQLYKGLLGALDGHAITALWWRLVLEAPSAYARHRLAVVRWTFLPPEPRRCLPVHIGIEGPADLAASLGIVRGTRPSDQALYRYAIGFVDTPTFLAGTYAAFALVMIVLLLRRRNPTDFVIAAMLGAGLAFAASYIAIGIACDFRYTYFTTLATLLALVYCVGSPGLFRRERTVQSSRATA